VLAGCTALLATFAAPFVHFWNYTTKNEILSEPRMQYFNATVRSMEYQSGGDQRWQGLLYIPLFLGLVINIWCFTYMMMCQLRDGDITGFTEPQNLFGLAIMSPPSHALAGSCGGGPTGKMMGQKWRAEMMQTPGQEDGEEDGGCLVVKHPHFYISCPNDGLNELKSTGGMHTGRMRKKKNKTRPASIKPFNGWNGESPAVAQYERLSQTKRGLMLGKH
jgi:hypothetical protein